MPIKHAFLGLPRVCTSTSARARNGQLQSSPLKTLPLLLFSSLFCYYQHPSQIPNELTKHSNYIQEVQIITWHIVEQVQERVITPVLNSVIVMPMGAVAAGRDLPHHLLLLLLHRPCLHHHQVGTTQLSPPRLWIIS